MDPARFLHSHVAVPSDHGAWVFLLSPLVVGLVAGGRWTLPSFLLAAGALAGFMARQPIGMLVRIGSGRRSRQDLPAALSWTTVYGAVAAVCALGLVLAGQGKVLLLAIPAAPVFARFLQLVGRREERRRWGVEILGAGALALTAPAALWIARGRLTPDALLLWALVWLQSVVSIVYVYLRLVQREWKTVPGLRARLRSALPALSVATLALVGVIGVCACGLAARWLFLPYLAQWVEVVWGSLHPAAGQRPSAVGLRQLAVSVLCTALFVVTWR